MLARRRQHEVRLTHECGRHLTRTIARTVEAALAQEGLRSRRHSVDEQRTRSRALDAHRQASQVGGQHPLEIR